MNASARRSPLKLIGAVAALAGLVALVSTGGSTAQAAESDCPNTFHVLHNDHIGKLKLRAGHYTITLLDDQALGCAKASRLLTKFLEDFDGNLPGRWKVIAAQKEFRRGNTDVGFRVAKGGRSGNGGHHPAGNCQRCPGTFQVEHKDRIGKLKLPAGPYRITILTNANPDCAKASKLFARFLQDTSGNLPGRWRLQVRTATFTRRNTPNGFRVKPA